MGNKEVKGKLGTPVDIGRRRLTKAGLAAPAVIGVLASRPVLGNTYHHCSPSGHMSGFASPNPNAAPCSGLGYPPSHFQGSVTNWPDRSVDGLFINDKSQTRQFRNVPRGMFPEFVDAYQIRRPSDGKVRKAKVNDLVEGCATNTRNLSWTCNDNWVLEPVPGMLAPVALGQAAVVAVMNALAPPLGEFPLPVSHLVDMFNQVAQTGQVEVQTGVFWNAAEFKEYLSSLWL